MVKSLDRWPRCRSLEREGPGAGFADGNRLRIARESTSTDEDDGVGELDLRCPTRCRGVDVRRAALGVVADDERCVLLDGRGRRERR